MQRSGVHRTRRETLHHPSSALVGGSLEKNEFCRGFVQFLAVLASPSERLVERCRAREGARPAGSKQRIGGGSGRIPEQRLRDPAGDGREKEGAGQADEGQSPAQDAHFHGQAADGPQGPAGEEGGHGADTGSREQQPGKVARRIGCVYGHK